MLIRALDIVLSATALALLAPLLLPLMLALRLTGEGEVFFRQQRVGRRGEPFGVWKFATMLKASPGIGTGLLTVKDDPRVLPLGRVLRATKINELPQLINVLAGDMSLIGPRPQAPPHFEVFPEPVRRRLRTVRPGLSGIGSIVFRDEERCLERAEDKERFYAEVIAPYKGALECWFIERRCVRLYLLLIFLTVWAVAFPGSGLYRSVLTDLPPLPPALADL